MKSQNPIASIKANDGLPFPRLKPGDLLCHQMAVDDYAKRLYLILTHGKLDPVKTKAHKVEVYTYGVLDLTMCRKHNAELTPTSNWKVYHII